MPRPAVLLTLRFCEMLWAMGGKKLLTAEFAEKIRRGRREKPLALFSPRSQRFFSAFSAVKGFLFAFTLHSGEALHGMQSGSAETRSTFCAAR